MNQITSADLPIGFGLGRSTAYWQSVMSSCIENQITTSNTKTVETIKSDPDILEIENVAAILRCSIDKIRRISKKELPARIGPGKKLLYHRDDVLTYFNQLPCAGNHDVKGSIIKTQNTHFNIDKAYCEINGID